MCLTPEDPSDCVFECRVRTDGDEDLAATNLPLFILRCEDRKADGYAEGTLDICNKRLKNMKIGVRFADTPPAVSYLAILGAQWLSAEIVAVDKTVIVIRLKFWREGGIPMSYLIYDAVALSLRMIPAPTDHSWVYTLSSSVSVARPCRGPDYALVHTGRLVAGGEDSLYLWRPSSSSPPWSDFKKAGFLDILGWSETNTQFSFKGHAYWVDLRRGAFFFSCDALFGDRSSVLKFLPLPVEPRCYDQRIVEPAAYRTMGIVRDSSIRFVSINGFQLDYVKLKERTVTVWKLLGHDNGWEMEHELSLETLWGFEGFGDVPKHLTPMYPLLSTKDPDVIYLGLGDYRETKIVKPPLPPEREFFPYYPLYMLTVDMRNKIVRASLPLRGNKYLVSEKFPRLVSCGFSPRLRKALVGPCDDGVPIPMEKKPRLEEPSCC